MCRTFKAVDDYLNPTPVMDSNAFSLGEISDVVDEIKSTTSAAASAPSSSGASSTSSQSPKAESTTSAESVDENSGEDDRLEQEQRLLDLIAESTGEKQRKEKLQQQKLIDEAAAATATETDPIFQSLVDKSEACGRDAIGMARRKKKKKKRVSFADDCGQELCQSRDCPTSDIAPELDVRTIMKDAYVPPPPVDLFPGLHFLSERSVSSDKPLRKWQYCEPQPIDDYCKFAKMIEDQLIVVENIAVTGDKIICTIKVKVAERTVKKVFARITTNNWISFIDLDCHPVPVGGNCIGHMLYEK